LKKPWMALIQIAVMLTLPSTVIESYVYNVCYSQAWLIRAEAPEVVLQEGIAGTSIIYLNATSAKVAVDASWLYGWGYRKKHVIKRAEGAGENYQVWFNVYRGSGVDYGNSVYLNDHAEAFPHDIRFTSSDGKTLLNFWVENYNSTWAKIWVKVAEDLSASDRTIYIYYGNPNATPASNFDGTFTKDFDENGLAGLWHMDEGAGTVVADSSGNANNGVLSGARWDVLDGGQWDGRPDMKFSTGSALIFDGADDFVNCGRSSTLNLRSAITIEAWIYPTGWGENPQNGYGRIVDKTTFVLFLNKGTVQPRRYNLVFGLRINGIMYYGNTPTNSITLNAWHHIVAVYDSVQMRVYINGVSQTLTYYGNMRPSGSIDDSSQYDLLIGDSATSNRCFQGKIDEVRIYNRVMDVNEVRCHYERRKYACQEPTHGEWGVEEKTGTTTFDYVLKVVNRVTSGWSIRLKAYNERNIERLSNCTIYFYGDGNEDLSIQICILNGVYSQRFGNWYNLTGTSSACIAITFLATDAGITSIHVYLEVLVPCTSTYNLMEITFEIS